MTLPLGVRRKLIGPGPEPSIRRQCELLEVNRSGWYYKPAGESSLNLELMKTIDELYTENPFYGSRKLWAVLRRQGHLVNRKRVQRLMRLMGIEGICPKRKTSKPDKEHEKYPYLLRGLDITHPNQVWATDITYIPMHRGFLYLVAMMDLFSRFVLAWELSNSLDTDFCIDAIEKAFMYGEPEIFNSDQGCQFTSIEFTSRLKPRHIRISMDGRRRVYDNIWVERLWRSLKYEEVYLNDYESCCEAMESIDRYFRIYNWERPHQSLNYETPASVYMRGSEEWSGIYLQARV